MFGSLVLLRARSLALRQCLQNQLCFSDLLAGCVFLGRMSSSARSPGCGGRTRPRGRRLHGTRTPNLETNGTRSAQQPQTHPPNERNEILRHQNGEQLVRFHWSTETHQITPNGLIYTELRRLSFGCPQGRRQRQTLQRCKEKPLTFNKKLSHMDYRPGVRLCWVQTGVFVEQLTQHEHKVNDLLVVQSRVLKLQVLTV